MKMRTVLSLGLTALVFGGTMVGCTATGGTGIASASDRNAKVAGKTAGANAAHAATALARRDPEGAIRFAEAAVALAPRDAGYRMTLAQGYLKAGRFASARQAFADVLELDRGNGKAALNLALAQTATGDWAAARKTLDANARAIPVGDLGLALALAGDPQDAVTLLMTAARSPQADAKIRQNLAFSLALAGQWGAARMAASADMSPADVEARLQQWAALARPEHASDQVAALLGVTPAEDGGQPVALALNAPVPMSTVPVTTATPSPAVVAVAVPVVAVPASVPTAPAPAAISPGFAKIVFGPAREIAQPIPPLLIRNDTPVAKVALARPTMVAPATSGDWYVQLGAYENAGVARDGWNRARRRFASLQAHAPTGMSFTTKAGSFYRLSVGGFSRAEADRLCRSYRSRGGACFVRRNGGDQTAQWLAKRVQVASR